MLRRVQLPALLVGTALTFGACGDSLPTGTDSGDELSQAEVQELVTALFALLGSIDIEFATATIPMGDARLSLSVAAIPINETFSNTDECDEGTGTASVNATLTGDVDEATNEGDATLEGTLDFNNCVYVGEVNTYTIDGDPEIGLTADFELRQESITISIALRGGIAFSTEDDQEGTCAVDIEGTATSTGETINFSASGRICGINASALDIELN